MSNDLSCIFFITRKQYELMASRLGAYGVIYSHTKEIELALLSSEQSKKQEMLKNNQKMPNSRKFENSMIRMSERNSSVLLIGNSCTNIINEQFMNECSFYRMQNTFIQLMNQWSIFIDIKQIYKHKIQIQVFNWNKLFQFQFIYSQQANQQILLIIRDLTATSYIDKTTKLTKQYFQNKLCKHFKDIFALFCSVPNQINPFGSNNPQNHQNRMQPENNQNNNNKMSNKFDDKIRPYIDKILRFLQKKNDSNNKIIQFWMIRLICIIEFVLKDKDVRKK